MAFPPFHVCFHSRKLCQAQSSPESHGGAMPLPFTSVWGSQDGVRSVQQFQIQPWFLQTRVTPCYICSDSSNVWNILECGAERRLFGAAPAFAVDFPATETTNSLVVIFGAPFISLHNVNARVHMDIAGSLALVLAAFHPQALGC